MRVIIYLNFAGTSRFFLSKPTYNSALSSLTWDDLDEIEQYNAWPVPSPLGEHRCVTNYSEWIYYLNIPPLLYVPRVLLIVNYQESQNSWIAMNCHDFMHIS